MSEYNPELFGDDDQEDQAERFTLNKEQLFKRLSQLESDKLVTAADISQLKKDAAYDEDDNPKGLDKDEIKLIAKAAQLHAKKDFEEKRYAANLVFAKYEELTGYKS